MRKGNFILTPDGAVGVIFDRGHPKGIAVHLLQENGETLMRATDGRTDERYFGGEGELTKLEVTDERIPESRRG